MLKSIKPEELLRPEMYQNIDNIKKIETNTLDDSLVIKKVLKDIIKKDPVIQDSIMRYDFYKRNFSIDIIHSALKGGFDGYEVESLSYLYNLVVVGYYDNKDSVHLQLEEGLTDVGKEVLSEMLEKNEVDRLLIELYSGKYVEDVKEVSFFEYIQESEDEIKIDFVDKLFADKGFRQQGTILVSTKTIKELNFCPIMEAFKRHVNHLYLNVFMSRFNSKNCYLKFLSWV